MGVKLPLVLADSSKYSIKPPKLFPFCVVWTPIPFITWLIPFVGHMGVCSSSGMIYDFAGFGVTQGKFAFGDPTRYLPLDAEAATSFRGPSGAEGALASQWDSLLDRSAAKFEAAAIMFLYGFFVNVMAFIKTLLPFALVMSLGLFLGGWQFFVGWAASSLLVTFVLIFGDAVKKLPMESP